MRNSSLVERLGVDNNRASNIIPKLWIQIKLTGRGAFQTMLKVSCEAWDGKKDSGDDAPDGGYFYVLEVVRQGKTESFKGSITLIR